MDLLNDRPVTASLEVRATLLANWMLLHAVGHVNAQREDKTKIDDLVLLDTLTELLVFLQHVIKRSIGSLGSKRKRSKFMATLIDALEESLEAILNKMGVDTEQILDTFVANLEEIDRLYDGYPLEVEGSQSHVGALMREGKVRIVTTLFGDYDSKEAVTFSLVYPMQLSLTIKGLEIAKFVA